MAAEFTCCECGRDVTVITSDEPPLFNLCAVCLTIPGWYRCPRMRAFLCTDHDGREPWEREASNGGL